MALAWCPCPPDETRLGVLAAALGNGRVVLWAVPRPAAMHPADPDPPVLTVQPVWEFAAPEFTATTVSWRVAETAPRCQLAAGSAEGDVMVWDLSEAAWTATTVQCQSEWPRLLIRAHEPDTAVRALAFASHAANLLASVGADGRLLVWDLRQPSRPWRDALINADGCFDVAWAPVSNYVIVATASGIRVFDICESTPRALRLESHVPGTAVPCLSLSMTSRASHRVQLLAGYGSGLVMSYDVHLPLIDHRVVHERLYFVCGATQIVSRIAAVDAAPEPTADGAAPAVALLGPSALHDVSARAHDQSMPPLWAKWLRATGAGTVAPVPQADELYADDWLAVRAVSRLATPQGAWMASGGLAGVVRLQWFDSR